MANVYTWYFEDFIGGHSDLSDEAGNSPMDNSKLVLHSDYAALEARCREQAEVLDIIAGDMEQCVGSDNYSLGIVSGEFYRRIVGASASETSGESGG